MGRLKALTFASVLALGAAQAAHAADLLPPPPPIEVPLRGAVEEPSGFYVRVDGGIANTVASNLRSSFSDGSTLSSLGATQNGVSLTDSWLLGIGLGYQVNSWLRFDGTAEYRSAVAFHSASSFKWGQSVDYTQANYNPTGCAATVLDANSNAVPGTVTCGDDYSGLVKTGVFLFNTYFDIGTWRGFTPYVGAGVGMAVYQTSNVKDVTSFPNTSYAAWGYAGNHIAANLAWAVTAGVSYHITPSLLLDANYRYLNMGDFKTGVIACNDGSGCHGEMQTFSVASNDVRLGLRWLALGEPVYEPMVRAKY
ncbi:opacity protein-like surface antigen [Rhodoblastus acidophilus]|nr:outer membrane beta-barrel protein [Rhodoblastus acidophilus]MCW2275595.1 opacity protein-like surface antigen [Rhodoblastus acidophilus]